MYVCLCYIYICRYAQIRRSIYPSIFLSLYIYIYNKLKADEKYFARKKKCPAEQGYKPENDKFMNTRFPLL